MAEIDMETGEVIEPDENPDAIGEEQGEPFEEPTEAPAEEEEGEAEAAFVPFDQRPETEQNKVIDRLDREAERHTKRLTEILEEEALMLLPCELCNPRHAGWVNMTQISEETRQRVRVMIGDREPRKLIKDPYSERCPTCEGETVVDTGSKDPKQAELPCITCEGKGWIPVGPERDKARPAFSTVPVAPPEVPVPQITGPTAIADDPDVEEALALIRGRGYSAFATKLP